jgi:hypothetical protein
MDNLSSQIGALEFGGHLTSFADGVLEAAGVAPGPTHVQICVPTIKGFNCVSDAALEVASAKAGPATFAPGRPFCASDDAALELAGTNKALSPTAGVAGACVTQFPLCR